MKPFVMAAVTGGLCPSVPAGVELVLLLPLLLPSVKRRLLRGLGEYRQDAVVTVTHLKFGIANRAAVSLTRASDGESAFDGVKLTMLGLLPCSCMNVTGEGTEDESGGAGQQGYVGDVGKLGEGGSELLLMYGLGIWMSRNSLPLPEEAENKLIRPR